MIAIRNLVGYKYYLTLLRNLHRNMWPLINNSFLPFLTILEFCSCVKTFYYLMIYTETKSIKHFIRIYDRMVSFSSSISLLQFHKLYYTTISALPFISRTNQINEILRKRWFDQQLSVRKLNIHPLSSNRTWKAFSMLR